MIQNNYQKLESTEKETSMQCYQKIKTHLGTVWNAWQTTWVGEPSVVETETQAVTPGSWSGEPCSRW